MPEIDLGIERDDFLDGYHVRANHRLGEIDARLKALLAWPQDDRLRREFLAVAAGQFVPEHINEMKWLKNDSDFTDEQAEQIRQEIQTDMTRRYLAPVGGMRGLAHLESSEKLNDKFDTAIKSGMIAGHVLMTLFKMKSAPFMLRQGPSIAKAREVVAASNPGITIRKVRDAWKSHKSVAPLSAGMLAYLEGWLTVEGKALPEEEVFMAGAGFTLAIALQFEEFMLNFVPTGHTSPAVEANEVWRIPLRLILPSVHSIDQLKSTWSDTQIATLQQWRKR